MDPVVTAHASVVLPLAAAFSSAATFGLSSSLQHRVVGTTDASTHSGARLLARLLRSPSWVIGIALSVGAFALHAAAITLGSLALVQPVIVSGIVFAVLIRAALDRRLPSGREIVWSVVTWAGLALFIAVVHATTASEVPNNLVALAFAAASLVAAGVSVRCANTARTPERRGLWFGFAAGVLFGLVAGLLKIVTGLAAQGPLQVIFHWPVYIMVPAGLWAMTMNQRAYQVTRLSVSMPVLNIVDVLLALGFAAAVFGEHFVTSPITLLAEVAALGLMAVGVRQLARTEEQVDAALEEPTLFEAGTTGERP